MGDLAVLAVGLAAIIGAVWVTWFEFQRYRRDPALRRSFTPEEASNEPFHNSVAVLIALVSICGALLAWRASTTSGSGDSQAHGAAQTFVHNNEVSALVDTNITFCSLQTLQWQGHLIAAQKLRAEADAAWIAATAPGNAGAAADHERAVALDAQAREEAAAQRFSGRAFLPGFLPQFHADGSVACDPTQIRDQVRSFDQDYRTLGAVEAQALGDAGHLHHKARYLVFTGILFAIALLFLTVANLGPAHRRLHAAIPGIVALAGGMIVFAAVEQLL